MSERCEPTSEAQSESSQSRSAQEQPSEMRAVRVSGLGLSSYSREERFVRRYIASALVTAALGAVVLPVAIPLAMYLHDRANYPLLLLGIVVSLMDFSLLFFFLWGPIIRMHHRLLRIDQESPDMTRGLRHRTIFGWGLLLSGIFSGFTSLLLQIPDDLEIMVAVACAADVIIGILLLTGGQRRKR